MDDSCAFNDDVVGYYDDDRDNVKIPVALSNRLPLYQKWSLHLAPKLSLNKSV